jgi:hypothetical protein
MAVVKESVSEVGAPMKYTVTPNNRLMVAGRGDLELNMDFEPHCGPGILTFTKFYLCQR